MLKQDYVLKAIEQLGEALARILGLQRKQQLDEALEVLQQAKSRLPLVPRMVDRLSVESLAKALEDAQLVRNVAQLYRLEAEIRYQQGDKEQAVCCLSRAKALLRVVGDSEG